MDVRGRYAMATDSPELGDHLVRIALDRLLLHVQRRLLLHDDADSHLSHDAGYAPGRDLQIGYAKILQATDVVDRIGVRTVQHDVERLLVAPVLAAIAVQFGDHLFHFRLVVNDADPAVAESCGAAHGRRSRTAHVDGNLLFRR